MSDPGRSMRVLVVGAGAIGGYFGGRLLEAGRDITFLVRPGRAAQLARDGLVIRSPQGDAHLPAPYVLAENLDAPFDLILLSCKAYGLDRAMENIAPAVGPGTAILPLLNGMRHLDALDARFGSERVLGGLCAISATLDPAGTVVHLGDMHSLAFGERGGVLSGRVEATAALMRGARFEARASEGILLDMWEKWVFLATLAGITCLMRASIGDIVAAEGGDLALALLEECRATAETEGYAPRAAFMARTQAMLTQAGSPVTASMLRDIERGGPIEADHVLGDLLRRDARLSGSARVLRTAYLHLKAYEARRSRAASG